MSKPYPCELTYGLTRPSGAAVVFLTDRITIRLSMFDTTAAPLGLVSPYVSSQG